MAKVLIGLGDNTEFVIDENNCLRYVDNNDNIEVMIIRSVNKKKMDGIIECLQRLKTFLP